MSFTKHYYIVKSIFRGKTNAKVNYGDFNGDFLFDVDYGMLVFIVGGLFFAMKIAL